MVIGLFGRWLPRLIPPKQTSSVRPTFVVAWLLQDQTGTSTCATAVSWPTCHSPVGGVSNGPAGGRRCREFLAGACDVTRSHSLVFEHSMHLNGCIWHVRCQVFPLLAGWARSRCCWMPASRTSGSGAASPLLSLPMRQTRACWIRTGLRSGRRVCPSESDPPDQ